MTLFESRLKSKLASPGLSLGLAQGVHACPAASGSRSSGLVISCSRSVLWVRGRLLHEPQGSLAGGLHTEAGSSKERLPKKKKKREATEEPPAPWRPGLLLQWVELLFSWRPGLQWVEPPPRHTRLLATTPSQGHPNTFTSFLGTQRSQEAAELIQVAPLFKLFSELNIISGF